MDEYMAKIEPAMKISRPQNMVGLRPNLSEKKPQKPCPMPIDQINTVIVSDAMACVEEKSELISPRTGRLVSIENAPIDDNNPL